MNTADSIAAVEETTTTERSRLGSDKALIAATGATLEPAAVRRAAATREAGVATPLGTWADDADGPIGEAFGRAATAAAERRDRLETAPGEPDALSVHLQDVQGTAERIGSGLVGVPLVADRFYLQVVNFFVNEADEGAADLARELRRDAGDLEPARVALPTLDDAARERAREAAVEAIGVAYEEYADSLEAMGLDPKPIC